MLLRFKFILYCQNFFCESDCLSNNLFGDLDLVLLKLRLDFLPLPNCFQTVFVSLSFAKTLKFFLSTIHYKPISGARFQTILLQFFSSWDKNVFDKNGLQFSYELAQEHQNFFNVVLHVHKNLKNLPNLSNSFLCFFSGFWLKSLVFFATNLGARYLIGNYH